MENLNKSKTLIEASKELNDKWDAFLLSITKALKFDEIIALLGAKISKK